MNAKEMFEALGYEYYEREYSILYIANCDMDEDHISIGFGLLSHTFYAQHNCDPYDITIDEFKAIGLGGLTASNKQNAIIASIGTGTAFIKANNNEIKHLGGSRSWWRHIL